MSFRPAASPLPSLGAKVRGLSHPGYSQATDRQNLPFGSALVLWKMKKPIAFVHGGFDRAPVPDWLWFACFDARHFGSRNACDHWGDPSHSITATCRLKTASDVSVTLPRPSLPLIPAPRLVPSPCFKRMPCNWGSHGLVDRWSRDRETQQDPCCWHVSPPCQFLVQQSVDAGHSLALGGEGAGW
jgi:hypothetical protein